MLIRSLKLENYRRFRHLELEFPLGLISLVGRNGSGKSTIVEAVAFALYGSVASRTGAGGVRSQGAGSKAACTVELECELGGDPLRIVRRIKGLRETGSAEVYRPSDPHPLASGVRGVEEFVSQRLGMTHATFIRSVFARQKEVHALSGVDPSERKEIIRRMIGIDRLDRAVKDVRREWRRLEERMKARQEMLEALPGLEKEEREKGSTLKRLDGEVEKRLARTENYRAAYKERNEHLQALEGARKDFERLERDLAGWKGREVELEKKIKALTDEIRELQGGLRELQKLRPREREYRKALDEKERLDRAQGRAAQRADLEKEKIALEKDLPEVRGKAEELKAKLKDAGDPDQMARDIAESMRQVRKEKKAVQGEAKKTRARRDELHGLAESLRKSISSIRKLGSKGRCPTCLREMGDDLDATLDHLKGEREKLDERLIPVEAFVVDLETRERGLDRVWEELEKRKEQAAEDRAYIRETRVTLDACHKEQKGVERRLAKVEGKLREFSGVKYDEAAHEVANVRVEELRPIYDQIKGLERETGRLEPKILEKQGATAAKADLTLQQKAAREKRKSLDFRPSEYDKARDRAEKAEQRFTGALEVQSGVEREAAACRATLERVRAELGRLRLEEERSGAEKEERRYLKRLESVFKEFQTDLTARVRPVIEEMASQLLAQVTEGRYPRIGLSESYDISILDNEEMLPLSRFSGGEEDLANLCLRMAISRLVSERAGGRGPSLIVLDEVFASQDEDRREKVLHALTQLTSRFQQILLITHLEEVRERVEYVLRITEDADQAAVAEWAT